MRTKEPHETMKHIVIRYTNGTAKKDAGPRIPDGDCVWSLPG